MTNPCVFASNYKWDSVHVYHRILSSVEGAAKFDAIELFGEGNVGAAFDAFPTQHVCNKYCKWFKLEHLGGTG
jgi:hypothetical protein